MPFTHTTAMLFWSALSLPPLITSVVYFRMSPTTEPVVQRLAVSAHGLAISTLYLTALLIGAFGYAQQMYGPLFNSLCWVPVVLIGYSFWRFRGKKAIHFLQVINLIWWLFAFLFGGGGYRCVAMIHFQQEPVNPSPRFNVEVQQKHWCTPPNHPVQRTVSQLRCLPSADLRR